MYAINGLFFKYTLPPNTLIEIFKLTSDQEREQRLSEIKQSLFFYHDLKELFHKNPSSFIECLVYLSKDEVENFNNYWIDLFNEENFYHSLYDLILNNLSNLKPICHKYSENKLGVIISIFFEKQDLTTLSYLLPHVAHHFHFKTYFENYLSNLKHVDDLMIYIETIHHLENDYPLMDSMPKIVEKITELSSIKEIFENYQSCLSDDVRDSLLYFSAREVRKDYAATLPMQKRTEIFATISFETGKNKLKFAQDLLSDFRKEDVDLLTTLSPTDSCYFLIALLLVYGTKSFLSSKEWTLLLNHSFPETKPDFNGIKSIFDHYPDLQNILIYDITFTEHEFSISFLQDKIMKYFGENLAYSEDFHLIPPFMIAFLTDLNEWFFKSRLMCNEKQLQALAYTFPNHFNLKELRYEFDSERFNIIFNQVDLEVQNRFIEWEKNQYVIFSKDASELLNRKTPLRLSNLIKQSMRVINSTNLTYHMLYHLKSCKTEDSCFYKQACHAKEGLLKLQLDFNTLFKTEKSNKLNLNVYKEDFLFSFDKEDLNHVGIVSEDDLKIFKFQNWRQWYILRKKLLELLSQYPVSQSSLEQTYATLCLVDNKDNEIQSLVNIFMDGFKGRLQGLRRQLESQIKTIKINLSKEESKKFNLRWHDLENNFNQNKADSLKIILTYLFNLQYRNDPTILLGRYYHQKEIHQIWELLNKKSFFKLGVLIERCDIQNIEQVLSLKTLYQEIVKKSTFQKIF